MRGRRAPDRGVHFVSRAVWTTDTLNGVRTGVRWHSAGPSGIVGDMSPRHSPSQLQVMLRRARSCLGVRRTSSVLRLRPSPYGRARQCLPLEGSGEAEPTLLESGEAEASPREMDGATSTLLGSDEAEPSITRLDEVQLSFEGSNDVKITALNHLMVLTLMIINFLLSGIPNIDTRQHHRHKKEQHKGQDSWRAEYAHLSTQWNPIQLFCNLLTCLGDQLLLNNMPGYGDDWSKG